MSKRTYVVVKESGSWKVMLSNGPVIKAFGSDYYDAIDHAKKLGRKNRRDVMVNFANGAANAEYYSYPEDLK
jgi:hypothetical protein